MLWIWIHIIFQDPDPFPGCLGSRSVSISYSHEHNKINWKGELNINTFCVGPVGPTDKGNEVNMYICIKSAGTVLCSLPLWNGKDRIRIRLESRIRVRICNPALQYIINPQKVIESGTMSLVIKYRTVKKSYCVHNHLGKKQNILGMREVKEYKCETDLLQR